VITRKIKWLSSFDKKNQEILFELEQRMQQYYSNSSNYYSTISFTENVWNESKSLVQQDIIIECQNKNNILEIGCGQAFILKTNRIKPSSYTGIDFSTDLINSNKIEYPHSKFVTIEETNQLPFPNESFDLLFSHFVIEHTVFPNKFLNECCRVLKSNGILIIVAPDFLGRLGITSQKSGWSEGTGRDKLKDAKYLDMLVTAFDNKIRIPCIALIYKFLASIKPRFFININPTCFVYEFAPDLDAVYLTYEREIKYFLSKQFKFFKPNNELKSFLKKNRLIYIKGIKEVK
jgi:ubiquinone/menaquinone biosynthesis C-methylase UbiE